MSLDLKLVALRPVSIWDENITHNLSSMALEAGLYEVLWRPELPGPENLTAAQAIPVLRVGLAALKADPERFKRLNPKNGWGDYEGLVRFVESLLAACEENPDATLHARV